MKSHCFVFDISSYYQLKNLFLISIWSLDTNKKNGA
jgi:hypothetical protein